MTQQAAPLAMLPAVNNGWAFAAFVILLVVSIYFGWRHVQ
jgi:membrane protein implicated in regulation of membrane protease activity